MVGKDIDTFCPTSQQHWRAWLQEHHADKQGVWLIYHKKKSGNPTLSWSQAVDEALCFGWIDSRAKPVNEETYMQFFCRRKPTSVWSKINKEKVRQLIDSGLMTEAGFSSMETAKQNGSWSILDDVEAGVIPADLAEAFRKNPTAQSYFRSLSKSDRRNILQWLVLAKRVETRHNRIKEIVEQADQRLKPSIIQGARKRYNAAD